MTMSPPLHIVLVLELVVTVCGVMITGSCPNVPPTHLEPINVTSRYLEVIKGLYSPDPSHVFKDTNVMEFEVSIDLNIQNEDLYKYNIILRFNDMVVNSGVAVDTRNENLVLNSTIQKDIQGIAATIMKCHHHSAISHVRMWYDGCFLIMWSCVNFTDKVHEEAVSMYAVMAGFPQPSNISFNETAQSLEKMARKYLNSSKILIYVNWSAWHPQGKTNPYFSSIQCTFRDLELALLLLVVMVLCFIVTLAISVLWLDSEDSSMRFANGNRVVPFNN